MVSVDCGEVYKIQIFLYDKTYSLETSEGSKKVKVYKQKNLFNVINLGGC